MSKRATTTPSLCPPLDDVIGSTGLQTVNPDQIRSCARFFDSDPNVITGFNFRLDALLNGGILFKRSGKVMTGAAQDWIKARFAAFLKEVVRWWWLAGFAGCIWEEDKFGGTPLCLDLTQLRITYECDVAGTPRTRYFARTGVEEREIPHVMTFFYAPPDPYGNLRSIIRMLANDHAQEMLMTYWTLVALKGRALPVMVTEYEKDKYDAHSVTVPTAKTPAQLMAQSAQTDTTPKQRPIPALTDAVRRSNADAPTPLMDAVVEQHLLALANMPHFSSAIQLPQGQKLIPTSLPEAPADLIAFRLARQERAFTLMGVPLAMVTNATSTGNKHQMGENSNAFVLFDNAQAALKQQLIGVAKQMFYSIHLPTMIREATKAKPDEKISAREMADSVRVEIEIPSIPNDDKLEQWFSNGWLKYEALIEHLASKHGISRDNFEAKPQLSVKEIAGHFEDAQPAGGAPKAKKAKST